MRVHVFALCWNERRMLPFFFRHYRPLAERFVILDDGSTDGSLEMLAAQPEVRLGRFNKDDRSFVLSALRFYDEGWKESRGQADWVIVCNVDEHLFHPDLPAYLEAARRAGVTAIPADGYQMVSDEFPEVPGRLCDHVRRGVRFDARDKLCIFNPQAIREIRYAPGRHRAVPEGDVRLPATTEVRLLHFKYLGLEYLVRRSAELRKGLLPLDLERGFGHRYSWSRERIAEDFADVRRRAEIVA